LKKRVTFSTPASTGGGGEEKAGESKWTMACTRIIRKILNPAGWGGGKRVDENNGIASTMKGGKKKKRVFGSLWQFAVSNPVWKRKESPPPNVGGKKKKEGKETGPWGGGEKGKEGGGDGKMEPQI